jgi:protein-L-isoaspartate(D-aspartate) O-methyltransferase
MDKINQAFLKIDRKEFIPDNLKDKAYQDRPLPIGYGQTISQPTTVRLMLEWLDARHGNRVLDVGSGSGWTTALLSNIVGALGFVDAVEIIPELLRFGKTNCQKLNIYNIKFYLGNSDIHVLPNKAPYDRILVSAFANHMPSELLSQLKIGGKMVIPIKNDVLEIRKKSEKKYIKITHPGFIFVPLI